MGCEESSVTFMFFGEGEMNLLFGLAIVAMNARNIEDDGVFFASDGNGFEGSDFVSFPPNVRRSADGTDELVAFDGELDSTGNDFLFDEPVASDAEHVI